MLLNKTDRKDELNFSENKYQNLEGLALAYIFAVVFILTFYDSASIDKDIATSDDFLFGEWIDLMQNHLAAVKVDTFGWYLNSFVNKSF